VVFVGTWIVRLFFLSAPTPLSSDELQALEGNDYPTASKFVTAADWRGRWAIIEHFRGGRVLWLVAHLTWGYLFPSNGQMAYALTEAFAVIAMLALAGAACHLYGERGFLMCLLVVSV